MSAESKALILKLTTLRDLLRKNCGVGPNGFTPGNTCGHGGGGGSPSEASLRRRKRGKDRKRRGPDLGIGPRSRAHRRKRAGRNNVSRRKFAEEARAGKHGAEGRDLHASQTAERKEHAEAIKAERKELRDSFKDDRKDLMKEIKAERKQGAKDRAKERASVKKTQEKETAKLEKTQAAQNSKLDAKYEAAKSTTKDPEALKANYDEKKADLAATHQEERDDLAATQKQERLDLKIDQRQARIDEREDHRTRLEDQREAERSAINDQHMSHRESNHDLGVGHRLERAEMKREAREERQGSGKAFDWVDVKAAADGVPDADAILAAALDATGYTSAWEADSLTDEQRRELLEAVVTEGRAWFRSEAEAMLGDLAEEGSKALFGAAKARVGEFFAKAKKHVRELFTAGVLAVTGPGPANQTDAIVQETQKQVAEQIQYLDRFQSQIVSEEKPLNQAVAARAEMYGVSVWSAALEVQRQAVAAAGKKLQERRVLGPAEEHCEVCPELAAKGWVKIGTLPKLGKTPCLVWCRCHFEFR